MAREIEFRGLIDGTFMGRKLEGWAHGYYYYDYENDQHFIKPKDLKVEFLIHPETRGECLFIKDRKGKTIFEGDVVKDHDKIMVVAASNFYAKYCLIEPSGQCYDISKMIAGIRFEVIGNIHQNPEILK